MLVVISGILSSIFLVLALYKSFLTTSFFTISLSLLKSTRTGTNLSTSNLSALLFELFQPVGNFFNLSYLIYQLQILSLLAKSASLANFYVLIPVAFFKSDLLHSYINLI